MAAPALVLLANGTTDPRVASTMHSLRKRLQSVRPDLAINVAFVEHCPPTGPQVVSALANRGATEVVLVPLALTSAIEHQGVEQVAAKIRATHPNVRVGVARPIGPAVELLTLLDERLRDAWPTKPPRSWTPWCSPPQSEVTRGAVPCCNVGPGSGALTTSSPASWRPTIRPAEVLPPRSPASGRKVADTSPLVRFGSPRIRTT